MKEGWSYKKLGEVCEILNGFAFKSNIYAPKGIRVIRITNVQKGFIEDTEPKFYPFDSIDELNRYLLKSQDLLISLTGNVGRVALLAENMLPAYLNQRVGCIRVKNEKELSISYLYHLLNSNEFEKNCIQSAHGAAQKNMSTVWLANYKIPIPPLQEQHSIVSRLDSAFSHIDALKANAEKQLNEARKLFQAELTECMKPKEGWEEKKLGEVATIQNGFAFKSNLFKKEGEPIIRISNIQNECIETKDIVYFCKEDYFVNFDNYRIFPNDILIAMSGGTTGKLGINRTNSIFYQNQRIGVIRENKKVLNHFYLYYFLQTKSEESLKIAAGAAQPNLSTAQIKNFIIPIIPLSVQQAIVSHLDSLSSTIRKLEELQQKTFAECDALKQAMLREVFE